MKAIGTAIGTTVLCLVCIVGPPIMVGPTVEGWNPLIWNVGPRAWASLVVAVVALLMLAVYAIAGLRRQRSAIWSRTLGCLGLGVAAAAVVHGLALTVGGADVPNEWRLDHAGWAALTFAALILAAYQWEATYFRALTVLALLAVVGRHVLLNERADDARVEVTKLDRQLAGLILQIDKQGAAAEKEYGRQKAAAEKEYGRQKTAAEKLAVGKRKAAIDAATQTYEAAVEAATRTQDEAQATHEERMDSAKSAQEAIGTACERVDGSRPAEAAEPERCANGHAHGTEDPAARVEVATATLAVANLKDLIVADDESKAAVVAAQGELAKVEVAKEQGDIEGAPVVDATVAGARLAVEAASGSQVPWQLTTLAWTLLLLALVMIYRWLEILNAGLSPGPVAFSVKDDTQDELKQIKKVLLLNFSEPGVQPGSQASSSITDLISVDEKSGTVAKALFGLLNATALPARGYEVTATIAATGPPAVVLSVASRRTGATRKVIIVDAPDQGDLGDAARRAAMEAAAWILTQSRGTPPWLQYPADVPVRVQDPLTTTTLSEFRAALGSAAMPGWPIVDPGRPAEHLVELGNRCDLAQRPAPAVLYYALALYQWPDYTIARYRLSASLCSIGTESERTWLETTLQKDELAKLVLKELNLLVGNGELKCDSFILEVSKDQLTSVLQAAFILPIRRLSIRERASTPQLRRWFRTICLVRSASQIVKNSASNRPNGRGKKLKISRDAGVAYNQACRWAKLSDGSRAKKCLERAITSPKGSSISLEWVAVDPDLQTLRDDSEYWTSFTRKFDLPQIR